MKKSPKIAVIGCGHMGQAIAHSLMQHNFKNVWITNHHEKNLLEFLREHFVCCAKCSPVMTTDNKNAVSKNNYILLCVRPFQIKEVLSEIKPFLKKNHVLISVAAGTPISALKKWSSHEKIVRVMPNLATQIELGMSVWKAMNLANKEKKIVQEILGSFGEILEVKNEDSINAATAVSGSGPAYVFAFLEALQKSAEEFGFSKNDAKTLALMTVYGSAIYASKQKASFEELKEKVKTKGGTTEAAFKILDKKHWQKILQQGIKNAYKRTKEISKSTTG